MVISCYVHHCAVYSRNVLMKKHHTHQKVQEAAIGSEPFSHKDTFVNTSRSSSLTFLQQVYNKTFSTCIWSAAVSLATSFINCICALRVRIAGVDLAWKMIISIISVYIISKVQSVIYQTWWLSLMLRSNATQLLSRWCTTCIAYTVST